MFEITIPVLNEEQNLEINVLKIYNYILKELPEYKKWKIVIADNGSTDQTQAIGNKMQKEIAHIKYIRVNQKGVGLALQTSWAQSNAEIVGYMDLDLATHLKHIGQAIKTIESGYAIVYATRLHSKSKVQGRSISRAIISRSFNFIVRAFLGVRFSDGMCGFKFMKKEVFYKLQAAGPNSKGWFFCTELLVLAEWLKLKLFELPVEWTDSKDSHVRLVPLTLEYLKSIIHLKHYRPNHVKK